ncbi:MAG: glycosyltransferase [Candidatus Peribacteraceae bacterium]
MKLLMISGDRSVASGKESAFFQTLSRLSTQFDRIDVLCPRVRGRAVEQVFSNVFLHPARTGRLFYPLWIRVAGRTLFEAHGHSVLTVHDYPPFLNGIGARLLLRKIRIPSVCEIHHLVGVPHAASLIEWCARMMNRLYLRRHVRHFTALRVVNSSVKQALVRMGIPDDRITIVPSVYLDLPLLDGIPETEKRYDFVFSARIVPNKDLKTVLSALAEVPNATMLIIGDGPALPAMKRHAEKLGLDARVTFAGWLATAHDVMSAMKSGSVFIMHSKSEGNPRVAIEAMALGLPVIATRVGIMPDVIEDGRNGLIVSGKRDDLTRALKEITSAEERIRRMGSAAVEDVRRFSSDLTLIGYASFLRSFHVSA